MHKQEPKDVFQMLKMRFPHIDLHILNPQVTFSQNLQNIIEQIQMPNNFSVKQQISSMKEAVDKQQLKIQKSLVNEDGVLVNITNNNSNNFQKKKQNKLSCSIQEESNSYWESNPQKINDLIQDIWQFGSSQQNRDWFQQ